MNEMIERVAQAMAGIRYYDQKRIWLARARAAIEAMREPTGIMKDAGAETYGIGNSAIGSLPLSVINGQPTKAYQAMIDAALAE